MSEVSLIAFDQSSGSILAIGNEAKQLIHDDNSNIKCALIGKSKVVEILAENKDMVVK